jgi:hypothetical protein
MEGEEVMQMCSSCKRMLPKDDFYRHYLHYKTCNTCNRNQANYKESKDKKRKIELETRNKGQLMNMYRAVKSGDKYLMKDCSKIIYKTMAYKRNIAESETELIMANIADAFKFNDKKLMTETIYKLIDYVEKNFMQIKNKIKINRRKR